MRALHVAATLALLAAVGAAAGGGGAPAGAGSGGRYGANDVATAKLLSEMTGRRTVEYRRESRNGGVLGGRRTESETEAGRPLLSPDEVRRLPAGEALVYVAGCAPIRGARVPFRRVAGAARG